MENRGGGGGRKLEREVSPDLILDPVKNSFLNSKENCTEPPFKTMYTAHLFSWLLPLLLLCCCCCCRW